MSDAKIESSSEQSPYNKDSPPPGRNTLSGKSIMQMTRKIFEDKNEESETNSSKNREQKDGNTQNVKTEDFPVSKSKSRTTSKYSRLSSTNSNSQKKRNQSKKKRKRVTFLQRIKNAVFDHMLEQSSSSNMKEKDRYKFKKLGNSTEKNLVRHKSSKSTKSVSFEPQERKNYPDRKKMMAPSTPTATSNQPILVTKRFVSFYKSDFCDKFLLNIITYIAALFRLEKIRRKISNEYDEEQIKELQYEMHKAEYETLDKMKQIAEMYGWMLVEYRFENDLSELKFYETVYYFCCKTVYHAFDNINEKLKFIIEQEVKRLFKTNYFNSDLRMNNSHRFLSARELWELERANIKPPSDRNDPGALFAGTRSRSPLISTVIPDKILKDLRNAPEMPELEMIQSHSLQIGDDALQYDESDRPEEKMNSKKEKMNS
eukprot:gb/GECH01014591.1/.p1 GENE.gb/GECH01014591.1/~~gb/GECH01014591.1/.p1  ORF type:complete len:429 (+),score=111.53 gb/GECH01014591.1/:1-1287(+)